MNRNPPETVKRILRSELGFGCPIPNCGSPYLEWHHFDPPWNLREHHNPRGMIALCPEHHRQADGGAFTIDQLLEYKKNAKNNWSAISGRFNWLRNNLIAVVGGNFYYEPKVIFKYNVQPIIWFERNEQNYLLLNLIVLTSSGENRAKVLNNEWISSGNEMDIICPPSAKELQISYSNGDLVKIEYYELKSMEFARDKYTNANVENWDIGYPIIAVEITNKVANTGIAFGPRETKFSGIKFKNIFTISCDVCIIYK